MADSENMVYEINFDTGERGERRLWREERPERVAAVCVQRSRTVGKAHTGHRNRTPAFVVSF